MFIYKIKSFFTSGHKRTILAKKNILFGFFIKALAMLFSFSIISMSIKYLGKDDYGVWVVLSGVVAWSNLFDLGLTNGLRNKIAESIAKGDDGLSKYYVSTTYAFLMFICLFFLFISIPFIFMVDWQSFLKINNMKNIEVELLIFIVLISFLIQLMLKPITAILNAYQWPSISQFISLVGLFVSFLFLYYLYLFHHNPSLLLYFLLMSLAPILVFFLSSLYFYIVKFPILLPRVKNINFKYFKELAGFGTTIFIVQLSGLVIFQTDNIIISNIFGPESVTDYSIVYKFFSIFLVAKGIIISPFWSAFTDAYHRNEIEWIKQSVNKLIKIVLLLSVIVICSLFFVDSFYTFWIGTNISIPIDLSLTVAIFIITNSLFSVHPAFLNGVGKVKLQMYTSILAATINIPLSYLFARTLGFGVKGVVFATIICMAFTGVVNIIQYYKIINGSASGVWNK